MSFRLRAGVAALALITAACGGGDGDDDGPTPPPTNQPPTANFTANCVERTCTFTDASTDDQGIVSREWIFADEATSAEQNPAHTFINPGVYNVQLIVSDAGGLADTANSQVVVNVSTPAELTCTDPGTPGGTSECAFGLQQRGGFRVTLLSEDCAARGDSLRVVAPVDTVLFGDGCYTPTPTAYDLVGPFDAGTAVRLRIIAAPLQNPPSLRIEGQYPQWTLTYEDGGDPRQPDFNDLIMRVEAVPAP